MTGYLCGGRSMCSDTNDIFRTFTCGKKQIVFLKGFVSTFGQINLIYNLSMCVL